MSISEKQLDIWLRQSSITQSAATYQALRNVLERDVLTTALRDGYAVTNQTLFPLWGSTDPDDLNGVQNIMAGLSAAYLGVQLAEADMWEDESGNLAPVWDIDTLPSHGDPTPGSADDHCLLAQDYTGTDDTDTVILLTWGHYATRHLALGALAHHGGACSGRSQ